MLMGWIKGLDISITWPILDPPHILSSCTIMKILLSALIDNILMHKLGGQTLVYETFSYSLIIWSHWVPTSYRQNDKKKSIIFFAVHMMAKLEETN